MTQYERKPHPSSPAQDTAMPPPASGDGGPPPEPPPEEPPPDGSSAPSAGEATATATATAAATPAEPSKDAESTRSNAESSKSNAESTRNNKENDTETGKPTSTDGTGRTNRPGRTGKATRTERATKAGKTERAAKPGKTSKPGKASKPGKIPKSGKGAGADARARTATVPSPDRAPHTPAAKATHTPAANATRTPADPARDTAGDRTPISRRRLLGTAGATGAAGLVVGGGAGAYGADTAHHDPTALTTVGSTAVPFHGRHQAGISTPLQARGHLLAFDLSPGIGRKGATALLRRWSRTTQELMAGEVPPDDTGIALDAGPSSLTVTIGFGRSFFARTGLTHQLPAALDPLPHFTADALDPKRSDGDLWIQIGADDALVAFHALRALQREAAGDARLRWQMNGFNRTPGATERPMTVRNLMGQVDGTNNPKPTDHDFDRKIFVPADGSPAWMAGGSYAVVRRIRMLLDSWDELSLAQQERVIGRRKSNGAPLSGGTETTPVDLGKVNPDGSLAIAGDAHIRVAAPASNQGASMLRRTFSYHDGFREDGAPDAGLLFIAWQADPDRGFVPVQRKLDRGDGFSRFLRHEASGLFAVPGGCGPGEYLGQRLLEG